MSPVHRSSSNVDTSGATALALTSSDASHTHKTYHFSEGEEELEDTGIQRSFSMPPAMFDNEEYRPARNRERSGLCIQRRHRNHQSLMFDQEFGLGWSKISLEPRPRKECQSSIVLKIDGELRTLNPALKEVPCFENIWGIKDYL